MVHSANNTPLINLNSLPRAEKYFVAFSGGLDSSVLLYTLSQSPLIKSKLTAIHVNHNINADSQQWADRCQLFCDHLDIPLISQSVSLTDTSENTCRVARQNVFKQHLTTNDCLLTGHHQDDHIETILFRLTRGTGLNGITGISVQTAINGYKTYRPLLHLSKNQLYDYATQHHLSYVDDPSNSDNRYSRNFIRNEVIPKLKSWDPGINNQIELTAKNLTSSLELISHLIGKSNPLCIKNFSHDNTLATAIYHWLYTLGIQAPHHKRIQQFANDCLKAAHDKNPELTLTDCRLIRWNDGVHAVNNLTTPDNKAINTTLSNQQSIRFAESGGVIQLSSDAVVSFDVEIRFNQCKESMTLTGHKHNKIIKKIFQEKKIPPWERSFLPYLYLNTQLMAVGSNILSADFEKLLNTHNAEYEWLSPQFLL